VYVVILRRQWLFWLPVAFFLLLGALFTGLAWLTGPYPLPRLGLPAAAPDLAWSLFPGQPLAQVGLGQPEQLRERLKRGELDYLVELEKPDPALVSWQLGCLVPAVVVPFFDPLEALDLTAFTHLIQSSPEKILVSQALALPGFPWWDQPVRYLPSPQVIQELQEGRGRLGVILLQERKPAVRIVPLNGVDPKQCRADPLAYPLTRALYLSRPPKGFAGQLRDWVQSRLKNPLDALRLAAQRSGHAHPWAGEISLVAAGDIMLDRDVKKVGLERGWEYIFAEAAPALREADLSFANLESPLGDRGRFINMFQAPPEAVEGLAFAGLDVVSLANNHALDYHHEGLLETMRLLREYGIDWVGAGRSLEEARAPLIREAAGVKIGFLAYTEMWFVYAREPISWRATADEPGVAPAEIDLIVEDVQRLRSQVDVVVVSMHWGKEYVHEPTEEQKRLARAAVDAGADLVLGHHPHVLQGLEFYQGGVIAYSLGNFVFDLNRPATWETMLLEFTLSAQGVRDLTIVPAFIAGVRPRILEGAHREAVYQRIREYSLGLK